MSDLLNDARELRQKLHRLEVLLEIEKGPRAFLQDVRAKVGAAGGLDWTRADEIDFSKL